MKKEAELCGIGKKEWSKVKENMLWARMLGLHSGSDTCKRYILRDLNSLSVNFSSEWERDNNNFQPIEFYKV